MNAMDIEIRKRNARFRVWSKLGVPIEGRWVRFGKAVAVHLACVLCRKGKSDTFRQAPFTMEEFEQALIEHLQHEGCSHLKPLLENNLSQVQKMARFAIVTGK